MLTFVRTAVAQPDQLFELVAAAKELAAIVKKLVDRDVSICSTIGGNIAEVAWIWQSPGVETQDERFAKLMANPEYLAVFKKIMSLSVPNTSHEKIYRHI
jgi:hypothetical protein